MKRGNASITNYIFLMDQMLESIFVYYTTNRCWHPIFLVIHVLNAGISIRQLASIITHEYPEYSQISPQNLIIKNNSKNFLCMNFWYFEIENRTTQSYNCLPRVKRTSRNFIWGLGFEESFLKLNYVNRTCYQHEQ